MKIKRIKSKEKIKQMYKSKLTYFLRKNINTKIAKCTRCYNTF